MNKLVFLGMVLFSLVSCSKSDEEIDTPNNGGNGNSGNNEALIAAENYYNNTLKSVITTNCTSCHTGFHSGNTSYNFGSFSNARNAASNMYIQVNAGNMPKDADKLSAEDISKFQEFRDLVNAIK